MKGSLYTVSIEKNIIMYHSCFDNGIRRKHVIRLNNPIIDDDTITIFFIIEVIEYKKSIVFKIDDVEVSNFDIYKNDDRYINFFISKNLMYDISNIIFVEKYNNFDEFKNLFSNLMFNVINIVHGY